MLDQDGALAGTEYLGRHEWVCVEGPDKERRWETSLDSEGETTTTYHVGTYLLFFSPHSFFPKECEPGTWDWH